MPWPSTKVCDFEISVCVRGINPGQFVCVWERDTLTLGGEQLGSVNMLFSVPQLEVPAPIVHFIHRHLRDIRIWSSGGGFYSQQSAVFVCVLLQPLIWICYLPSFTLRAWLEPIKHKDKLHVWNRRMSTLDWISKPPLIYSLTVKFNICCEKLILK